jgi:gamma-glutamylcyclotransferase (GGCT)/AIG2-like uncharacterized protein YtfP
VSPNDVSELFVYGTLMRGGCRHYVLASQHFLRQAWTAPLYDLLDLGAYPGLIRCDAGGREIQGELFEVVAPLVPLLDEVEGAPLVFRREPVVVNGSSGTVFAYFYQLDTAGQPRYRGHRWHNSRRGGPSS